MKCLMRFVFWAICLTHLTTFSVSAELALGKYQFRVADGFSVELVAAPPLVKTDATTNCLNDLRGPYLGIKQRCRESLFFPKSLRSHIVSYLAAKCECFHGLHGCNIVK